MSRKIKAGVLLPVLYEAFKMTFDRKIAPKAFREFLDRNGTKIITNIELYREPVKSVVQKVLNVISFGYWDQVKDQLKYDDVFHLYMVVTLDDGSSWRLEKNHIVQAKRYDNTFDGLNVPLKGKHLTLYEFINNGVNLAGRDVFYKYNAANNNCQVFCFTLLQGSGLDSEKAEEYILQDTEHIVRSLPNFTQNIINESTDLAAIGDVILNGYALRKKKYKKRNR